MDNQAAYHCIAQKIEDQEPHTGPKAEDGSIHEAFISHLQLIYTPEEAEIVQHLNLVENFTSSEELAEISGKSMEYVEKILTTVHTKHGVVRLENLYCIPPFDIFNPTESIYFVF